jgi:poly-gamma-glutamate capsule biosynthesis protein CapA/YwtB (metallophosphatase superfamily)
MSTRRPPETPKDIFPLTGVNRLLYGGLATWLNGSGLGKYPRPTDGDYETMSRMDLMYWVYKAKHPVRRAWRGSGLEAFFDSQSSFRLTQPEGFKPSATLSLSAAGDLMDHPCLADSAGFLYEDVAELLFGADISMANLECVINPDEAGAFAFTATSTPPLCYKPASFHAAKGYSDAKFTFLTTANNHSLDCGEVGVRSTLDTLRAEGIAFNGTNENEDASREGTVIERNGFRIAVISHTFGLNGKKPPQDKSWIVNRTRLNLGLADIDFGRIEQQISHCRKVGADAIVGQFHWGFEHEYYPRPEQLEAGRHLAELGFDVVIGHHPHVVQPVEYYRTRRDPDRIVPIFYSLGNLITPFSLPAYRKSGIARLRLSKGITKDGVCRTYVTEARIDGVFLEVEDSSKKIRIIREKVNPRQEVSL